MISLPKIVILAAIQGLSELLPVSSSAHVIVAEKLMGLDPTQPEMTLLLVMLHTGTMVAVIVFFWRSWSTNFFRSKKDLQYSLALIITATVATGFVGLLLKMVIEKVFLKGTAHAEIELIFGNLLLISGALAAAGALILCTGLRKSQNQRSGLGLKDAGLIGLVQGVCLPFRGFSRSGATISTGLILGIEKKKVEDFSFALAVVLTPPVILREALRFLKAQHLHGHHASLMGLFLPSLTGMALSFVSGILALIWLSNWLERGRWYLFGFYCLFASAVILLLQAQGL
jgi:undecaprenyl-diphosphatase